jgi:DNA replication protein DnaC
MTEEEYNRLIFERYKAEQISKGEWYETPEDFSKALSECLTALPERKTKKVELTPEQQAKLSAYCKQVRMKDKQKITQERYNFDLNLMDLQAAKKAVWEIIQQETAERGQTFVFDDFNRNLLASLTKYFIRSNEYDGDLTKGLCIYGGVGRGKTFIMECMQMFAVAYELPTAFSILDMKHIARDVQTNGVEVVPRYTELIKLYDDVGFEELASNYGNKICVFTELLTIQYNKYSKSGKPCHITSNLAPSDNLGLDTFENRYGSRVFDRMRQMFNFHFLGGNSKRK